MFRFDSSNPQFLLVYTGDEHAKPDDYRRLAKEWAAALDRDERFGVVMIYEPHEHHEHDEDEHRQHEAEITRITNDFRRDYRERTMQSNLGFARVYSPEIMKYYEDKPEAWEKGQEGMNRYAQYSWGIPGRAFTNLDDAQDWLRQQIGRAPSVEAETVAAATRVGLFYGSSTGVTEIIAENIRDVWAQMGMEPIEAMNIGYVKAGRELLAYDYLILGISTWNIGQLQDDWDILFPQLDKLDFSGKTVAIFGIGDQENYADNFLDAIGILGDKLIERGAKLVGYWIDEHFEFAESKGFVDGKFMGLGIDEVNQRELSAQRVRNWVTQIIGEFALQPSTQTAAV
jgi:flavodoxin I